VVVVVGWVALVLPLIAAAAPELEEEQQMVGRLLQRLLLLGTKRRLRGHLQVLQRILGCTP
jgi:hypothetical protein